MSYFKQNYPDQTIQSMRSFGVYNTRINFGTSVRGNVASPTTQTTASFVVPALGSNVTIAVGATTNFVVGDYVMVGQRSMYLTTPVHSSTGTGTLACTGRYMQGRPNGAAVVAGTRVFGPAGQTTTLNTNIASLPGWVNITSANVDFVNRAQVPSNSYINLTNYAGVYKIISFPTATSMELQYSIAGDLRVGDTCIRDTSGSDTGAIVAQFYPIGVVPKGFLFSILGVYLGATAAPTTPSSVNPRASLGFIPRTWTGGPAYPMGEYATFANQVVATGVLSATWAYEFLNAQADTSDERICPMDGMTFGLRVDDPESVSYPNDISVWGVFAPM